MAGQPLKRAEMALVREQAEDVLERIASGETEQQICASLGVRRSAIGRLADADEEFAGRLARARARAAHALSQEALQIADDLQAEPEADPVRVADMRIKSRFWLAARWNRETYGDSAKMAVQVNIGSLHASALRRAHGPQVIDAQVISPEPAPALAEPEPMNLNDLL